MNIRRKTKYLYEKLMVNDETFGIIDRECRLDIEKEKILREKFSNSYPKIKNIPFIGNLAIFIYSQGFKNIAGLILIIAIFTVIKAPYFSTPFFGSSHPIKYNTYVEPAFYMSKHNNPFWFQNKYSASPITNPRGINRKIGHLPVMEWGLFLTYKLMPYGNLEFKTRLFTHLIGVMILIYCYLFFRKWLPINITLLILMLLSINSIFSLSTFVTVYDSLLILFMFMSLSVLNKYFENRDIRSLFWAGMLFGLGNSMKYSLFLWLAPLSLFLMYYRRNNNINFIRDYIVYIIMAVIPIITIKTSISWLPSSFLKATALFLIWIQIYFAIYLLLKHFGERFNQWIERLFERKILLVGVSIILFSIGYVIFNYFITKDFHLTNFITDKHLLFNFKFYKYMLLNQIKGYLTTNLFVIGIIGLIILCITRQSVVKKISISFLVGSLIYWIVASKPIFIHNYYTLIIVVLFSLMASTTIYYIVSNISSNNIKLIILLLFGVLIIPKAYNNNIKLIRNHNKNENISKIIQFVLNNTKENDFILHEGGYGNSLIIPTGRSFVRTHRLIDENFKEEIKTIGFSEAMKKYRIKYLFTVFDEPRYRDFAPLFGKTNIKEPSYHRTYNICKRLGVDCPDLEGVFEKLDNIVLENRIDKKFKLEANIGKFKFFSFVN